MKIEEVWNSLRKEATASQRRIDAEHPLDLYVDFEPPGRPGLVLICPNRPPHSQALKAIGIEQRQRSDGRWTLRVFLEDAKLLPVFAELCRDIVDFTRTGVEPERGGSVVLSRIDRWRNLLLAAPIGLDRSALRGLIGELLVLKVRLLPEFGADEAVSAWTGPMGTDQDFRLPSGKKLEVKAIDSDATCVIINGLGQLDGGFDPLELLVVRLEDTGKDAPNALSAPKLIEILRHTLAEAPSALQSFNRLLDFVGWNDADEGNEMFVRLVRIDQHKIDATFPRLVAASVPSGIVDATYTVSLPSAPILS